jgi:transcriptional regulator with XRE-family HTH domain
MVDGGALRALRLRRGLKQAELAERAGISGALVSDLELEKAGDVRMSTVVKLAHAFEMSPLALCELIAPKFLVEFRQAEPLAS